MRGATSLVVAAAGSELASFGPIPRGGVVQGLAISLGSSDSTDRYGLLQIRFFSADFLNADAFSSGESIIQNSATLGSESLALALQVAHYVPLGVVMDRYTWIGVQVSNPGIGLLRSALAVDFGRPGDGVGSVVMEA